MLLISVGVSLGLWAYAIALARFARFGPGLLCIGAVAGLIFFAKVGAGLTVVALQALLLILLSIYFKACNKPKRYYPAASFGVSVFAYALVILTLVWPDQQRLSALRQEFPLENMAERAPPPQFTIAQYPLKPETEARFMALENESFGGRGMRVYMLHRLHEDTTSLFVNSPGFGVGRFFRPTNHRLNEREEDQTPFPQPGERETSADVSIASNSDSSTQSKKELFEFHGNSISTFLDENRYGFVKSRKQVAGFLPHQFRWVPDPKTHFTLQTLDLIGLVVHKEPVAYVSDNLPRMEELRKAPTRELTEFESAGLDEIKKGDDLFARESENKLRLFGAIRATKQCTECHGCQRGDLLGAFSYVLKRTTP